MLPPEIEGSCLLAPVTIRNGDPVSFTVEVSGIPAPIVRWYVGGKDVKQSKDFLLKDNGSQYTLIISHVTEDVGTQGVSVVARNRMGETKRTIQLAIYNGKLIHSIYHNSL